MFKLFAIALFAISVNSQLLRDEERPTRYVLPYSGLGGGEEPEVPKEEYYKPNRRAERIPATAYQYDEAEEEYYRPQPRPKVESDNYRYQPNTPSHKDYEEILKNNHLARLRVQAKKQSQHPRQHQTTSQPQPVEQYLKEVNPTTKTAYQRPQNYLRFNGQSPALKHEQSEETPELKQSYRYVLQPDLQQQKSYQQYQYESQQEQAKPVQKTPHFNLVAYQKALITQQKLLAAENGNDDAQSKPPIYIAQNAPKKTKKQKNTSPSRQSTPQYEYYQQVAPQRPAYTPEAASARYPQPLTPRNLYPKNEGSFQVEDPLLYPEHKEIEYQTQAPVRATKQRATRPPRRKPKYQTEEPPEEYQPPVPKYQQQQQEEQFEYSPGSLKYQDEQPYRRPLPRPTKKSKYEEQQDDAKDDYIYQPLPKYQRENLPRRPPLPYQDPEARQPSRYVPRQYQEESKHLPQYQVATDLAYQPTAEVPVRHIGRGPSVSYRQTYPQYQYDRRQQQFITPVQPKTRHFNSVEYQNALIADQLEEEPTIYITQNPAKKLNHHKTQTSHTSRLYNYYTRLASQRQSTNIIKLAPIRYQQKSPRRVEKIQPNNYEVEEPSQDIQSEEQLFKYQPNSAVRYQQEQLYEETSEENENVEPLQKYIPETERKDVEYQAKLKEKPSRTTYLNGQFFHEEVTPLPKYHPDDLATEQSSHVPVEYDGTQPFIILVYDE